jgi:hypothetical protein
MAVATTPDTIIINTPTSYTYCFTMARSLKYANTIYGAVRISNPSGYSGHVHQKNTKIDFFKSVDDGKNWAYVANAVPADPAFDSICSGISVGLNSQGEEVIFLLTGRNWDNSAGGREPICIIWSKDQGENWTEFYDMTVGTWPLIPGGVCISHDGAPSSASNIVLSNGIVLFRIYNHLDLVTGSWQFYTVRCHIDDIDTAANWVWSKGYTDGVNQIISEAANCEIKTNGQFEGCILSVLREETTKNTFKQISYDYGLTWTTPVNMNLWEDASPNGYPPALIRMSNGVLVMVLGRKTMAVFKSVDEGVNWTQLHDFLNYPVPLSASYQSMIEISPKWVYVSWGTVARGDSEGWISYEYGNYYYIG